MKHLVLFSLFTVCASYSMDHKDLLTIDKNGIRAQEAFKVADEKSAHQRHSIVKNKPSRDKRLLNPVIKPDLYIDCALMRLPSDTGNENAHEVTDLYVYQVYWHAHGYRQMLDEDALARLVWRARTIRQLQVTDQEKKEVEEMVVKKLKEDDLLEDLLLWGKNEARPTKQYKIN